MQKSIPKLLTFASIITLANLSAGLVSIYLSLYHRFAFAALCMFLAALLDALDGVIARRLSQTTDFGAQLDSLTDLVSFGVAPYILILTFYHTSWLAILGALIPICGALRLARFNISNMQHTRYFIGLPIDASCLVGILVITHSSPVIACFCITMLCYLFISQYKFPRLF